jgi:hypothetical protein
MKRLTNLIAVGRGTARRARAATAGGLLCMLQGRNVTFGTVKGAPQNGVMTVSAEGARDMRVGAGTKVVRLELIRPEDVKPGEQFIALNGKTGQPSPAVAVFKEHDALWAVYQSMGHGTTRPATVAKTAKAAPGK